MKRSWILMMLLFFGCSSDVEKIELEDISTLEEGVSELNDLEDELDTIMNATTDIPLIHLSFLQDSLKREFVFSSLETPTKLDRYQLVSQEKIQWSSNTTLSLDGAHELYQASVHEYEDSLKCNTALFNWLDCFGKSCTEVKLGYDTLVSKGTTEFIWVTEKKIHYLKSACGNDAHMDRMKNLFTSQLNKKDLRYHFTVDCKGKLKWRKH